MNMIYQPHCENCGKVIPAMFNNDELFQYCPACTMKMEQDHRAECIPKTQKRLV